MKIYSTIFGESYEFENIEDARKAEHIARIVGRVWFVSAMEKDAIGWMYDLTKLVEENMR